MTCGARSVCLLAAATALYACGGDGTLELEPGGPPTFVDAGVTPLPEVAIPALPQLLPCPDGWTPRDEDGITWCDPWPGGAPEDCPPDAAHFPGTAGCTLVGTPCPDGDLPAGLPDGVPTVFVVAGAGGVGTALSPFGTLTEGLAAVPEGGIVAIGKGEYDETLVVQKPVTLWGACVSETRIVSGVPAAAAGVLTIESPDVHVTNLTVGPSERHGVWASVDTAAFSMSGVVVDRARGIGVEVELGARLEATDLVVLGTRDQGQGMGRGIGVETGSTARVRRALLQGNDEFGAFTYGAGTLLSMEDVVVRDTGPRPSDGRGGPGMMAWTGSTLEARRVVVEGSRGAGVISDERGSLLVLEDAVIRDVVAEIDGGPGGRGANVSDGGALELRRGLIEYTRGSAVIVGNGGRATVEDTVIRDGIPEDYTGRSARALTTQHGGQTTFRRVLALRSWESALVAGADRAALVLEDVTVRGIQKQLDGVNGRGLNAQEGALVEGERVLLEDGVQVGVTVFDVGTRVELTDLTVRHIERGTLSNPSLLPGSEGGYGLGCYRGGQLEVESFSVDTSSVCGVHFDSSSISLRHGVVSEAAIGACIQVEDFDVANVTDDVRFFNNDRNLDTTDLPIPLPSAGL